MQYTAEQLREMQQQALFNSQLMACEYGTESLRFISTLDKQLAYTARQGKNSVTESVEQFNGASKRVAFDHVLSYYKNKGFSVTVETSPSSTEYKTITVTW